MRIPTKFLLSHNSGSSDFIFSSCFRRENADYLIGNQRFVKVIPLRFERRTHALEGRCSIQLSYGTILNCGAKVRFFMKTTNFTSKIFIVYTKMIISNRKYKELFS